MWTQGKKLDNNHYEILKQLGKVGFGVTYKARNLRMGNFPVVIKRLKLEDYEEKAHSRLIDEFRREVQLLATLSQTEHPHIVKITNFFEEEGIPCFVMDFISGTNLNKLVSKKGRLSEEKAIAYMRDIGSALEFCHQKGIIHRDIKPHNIISRNDNRVMLIDFGIARETGWVKTTIFTPLYAPWEQLELAAAEDVLGKEGATKWRQSPTVDIYACAASLYYLVTGDTPIDPKSNIPLLTQQCRQEFPDNIPLSDRLKKAIIAGMEPYPENRPQSLKAWLDLLPTVTVSSPLSPAPQNLASTIPNTPTQISSPKNTSLSAKDWLKRGLEKRGKGDWKGAIEDYTKAIRLEPNDAVAYYNRGIARKSLNDYKGAIADHTKAIRLDPNLACAYYNRGLARNELKDYKKAITDYTKAIYLDPNLALAYYNRGIAQNELEDYKGAIADFTEAIRLDPNDATTYNNRSLARNELKDYKRAIADCNEAIRLDPNLAAAYNNRGLARRRGLKDYKGAMADYNEAIRLDPNLAHAYINRGLAYKQQEKKREAMEEFKNAAKLYKQQGDRRNYKSALKRIKELGK